MSYQDLVAGQRDWVNQINTNFHSQTISDTGAVYDSVQGLNGFDGKNMIYREITLASGLKTVYFCGWENNIPNVPKQSAVEAFKLPINWKTSGYYTNVSQVSNGTKELQQLLKLDPTTGVVWFTNPYDYDISNLSAGMSLVTTQVGV